VKTLKFNHEDAKEILAGNKSTTWRLYDDKDLSVDDRLKIIDKADPANPGAWKVIGEGMVTEVVEKKLGSVTKEDMVGHRRFSNMDEVLKVYQAYYGPRVTLDTPVKIIHFDFKDTADETPSGAMLLEAAKLYTDGGSRNNPGHSACAYVICDVEDNVVEKSGYYMGIATNNQAEYLGMIKGLERCRDLGIDKVQLHSDSQLVVNQMNGFYKVKNQELAPLHEQLKQLADSFEQVTFHYIPRALNAEADKEVNRILDDQEDARHHNSS
jgi:ribonuclease HI